MKELISKPQENVPDHSLRNKSLSLKVYIESATSENTRKAYRQDINHFMASGGLLPATTDGIVLYLQKYAGTLNPRTLARKLIALKNWHLYQGFSDPTDHPLVKKTLTGIQHIHGKPKEKASALTLEHLSQLADYLNKQDNLMSLRNNAMLQIAFFGAFRRSELVAIQFEHLTFVPEGIEIMVPRSKTDQIGEGQVCAIPYGNDVLCPVKALKHWLAAANITSGFIFRAINRGKQVSYEPITTQSVNLIVKSMAIDCQLPNAEKYSSHSLRRGFATTASRKGAPLGIIMKHGRWRHEGTVLGYIEEGQRFEENAAKVILG